MGEFKTGQIQNNSDTTVLRNWKEFVFLTVSGLNQDGTKLFAGEEGEKYS